MPLVLLENAGIEVSRLGFGCAGLMRLTSGRARRALLEEAFHSGLRHFDVARMYGLGRAESELGAFAKNRREQLTIATKFGIQPAGGLGTLAHLQRPVRGFLNRIPAARAVLKRRSDALHTPRR